MTSATNGVRPVQIADGVTLGGGALVLIAGPCVIESERHALDLAEALAGAARRAGMPYIFKASFDKANRTSGQSFRGPGLAAGLRTLAAVKAAVGVPILTDIHEVSQAAPAAEVADVLQIPAFLSRQTDLLVAAARTGRAVNVKKGQFLAPDDMRHAIAKVRSAGNDRVFLTERGFSFGYHNLVVDMRAFPIMRALGVPVVFDVTHSLQLPGGGDGVTAGLAEYIEPLASAGVGAGVDGVFLEVHENPPEAKSDAQNALALSQLESLLDRLVRIHAIARPVGGRQRMANGRPDDRPMPNRDDEVALARQVLETEANAILGLIPQLDGSFTSAVDLLESCTGHVIATGMGKSGHHRAQDGRDLFEHRHARPFSCIRLKPSTATLASCRSATWWLPSPRAARPKSSCGCSRPFDASARGSSPSPAAATRRSG